MKILHYSDKSSADFQKMLQDCDVLITTGDLTLFDFPGFDDTTIKKPAFGVYGNHDSGLYLEKLGITNLHENIAEWNGFLWGGFQGCLRYKQGGGPQFSEEEAEEWKRTFPRVDVLLLHSGPKGLLDDPSDEVHVGSQAVREYVAEKKPRYVFCGHQYSNEEIVFNEIKLFRTYGARIIEIDK